LSTDIYEALARTAQLLRMDVFESPSNDDAHIVDGLRATSARIVADRDNLCFVAGQTALVTLYTQLAMLGLQIDLDLPDLELLVPQPPLRELSLVDALRDYSDDLLPGGASRPADRAHITFALGDTPCPGADIRISGTESRAVVGPDVESARLRWSGVMSFGAIAAGAAGAAEAARAAVPLIADRLGARLPKNPAWILSRTRCVDIDLNELVTPEAVTGNLDVVSGGAITNAMIFSLLRARQAAGIHLRVIEPESLDLSNLNRYAMARRSLVCQPKTSMLGSYSRPGFSIEGVRTRLDSTTAASLRPWASKVAVGVDDIPSRWFSQQEAAASWVGVGATSHDYVLVSEHVPGQACAGCTHPRPDETEGPIPTIGFVSLWAGLVLALRVLSSDTATSSSGVHVWPFGLENRRGVHRFAQSPVMNCPVGCAASKRLRSTL
jgi:hypothetical protein